MQEIRANRNNSMRSVNSRTVLLLSVAVSVILIIGRTIDVYRFAFVGAVFEALWLPAIASACVLVGLSVFYWVKDQFNVRSLYVYALSFLIAAILFTVFWK